MTNLPYSLTIIIGGGENMKKVLLSPWFLGAVSLALDCAALAAIIVDLYNGVDTRYALFLVMTLVGTALGIVGIVIARRCFADIWPGGGFSVSLGGTMLGALLSIPIGLQVMAPDILQGWLM